MNIYILLVFLLFFSGCKTPPVSPPDPSASLQFKSVEASDTSKIYLNFTGDINNPGYKDALFGIEKWDAVINGKEIKTGITVTAAAGIKEIPVRMELDIPALIAEGVPVTDDFTVNLTLDFFDTGGRQGARIRAGETAVFPYIREPVFSITEIAILKAELVNTKFRVTIKIDNPNHFRLDLSSLEYELYGNNLLWAEGREKNIISVPEKSVINDKFFLTMNFINMRRDLLDQIIRLQDVNYRFNGKAFVSTGVEYLPEFKTVFNLSGYSKVIDADK